VVRMILDCLYAPGVYHIWPEDWQFGGADGTDPRADPRWHPTTYEYWDDRLEICWRTQTPLCDDEALDNCTWVASLGKSFNPIMVIAIRYNGLPQKLPWFYDKETDTLTRKAA
jgi:hypothetical protein